MKVAICPDCGSINTYIHDERFSDEGVRLTCSDCGYRRYFKDISDIDMVEAPKTLRESTSMKLNRTKRAQRRHKDITKAIRKKYISDHVYFNLGGEFSYYNNLHQYNKNKIYCSCPLCAAKSKTKYGRNMKISEIRKIGLKSFKRQSSQLEALESEV